MRITPRCTHHSGIPHYQNHRYYDQTDRQTIVQETMSGRIHDQAVSSQVECPLHSQQMKLYCYSCEQLICRDCTLVEHLGHNFEFLTKCAPRSRQELGALTVPLLKIQANITVAQKRLERIEGQIDVQEAKASGAIHSAFRQMRADLDQREVELMNKLTQMVAEKRSEIAQQTDRLQRADGEIQGVLDTVHEALQDASDGELMQRKLHLQEKVKRKERSHSNLPLQPVSADITSNFPVVSPIQNMSDFGDIFYATIDNPPISEVGKVSKVTLRLHKAQNLKKLHVDATFQSITNPDVATPVQLVPKKTGVYDITYVPVVRGRHDLVVRINKENIPGSPFRVFVKVHPSQLGAPVRMSDNMGRPYGITLAPSGELVVAQNGGKRLMFLDKKLKTLRSIVTDRFYYPRGVVVNSDGAVFSTDKTEYTLMKFKDLKLVKATSKGSQDVRLLKIINGYLYVCDMGLSEIHIFTEDLDHINSFPTPEVPNPHDLAEGEDGIYIIGGCDRGAKIGVYNYEGQYIRTLDIKAVTLSAMRGICFDCYGHIFVTQVGAGVEGVYVFRTSGEFVTSFGQASNNVMEHPLGITIDEDGFVYVCDHKSINKKIFVF